MESYSIFVGLDVHKSNISVGLARAGRGKGEYLHEISSDTESVANLLESLNGERVHFCYEAGPTGYGLYRYLRGRGYACEVVAPSLVPQKKGDRIKTNRRDAVKLATLSRAGELTAITVPGPEQESVRDLTRAREDAKKAEKTAKLTLGSFLLRHGKYYSGKSTWRPAHFAWFRTLKFEYVHQQIVFEDYVSAVERCHQRVEFLEEQMRSLYESWDCKPICDSLMALRGVQLITAMTIIAELGDLRRFGTARELMAYLGVVPTESTTGHSVHRGSITKAGNSHVRRLLVESAWSYRLPPRRTKDWKARAKNAPQSVQEIAWKAMVRLNKRYWRLTARKVKPQKIAIAVARELAGFIWAVAQECSQSKSATKIA
jgi:transposase